MACAVSTRVLVAALLATAMGGSATMACSSSGDAKGANPSGDSTRNERDSGRVDAGSSPGETGGADGSVSARDGGIGGGSAASPDAAPSDSGTSIEHAPDARTADGALPALVCVGTGPRFATGAPSHEFGPGQSVGQEHFPEWVLGPPEGGGACKGATTNVISLGNGGFIELEFAGNAIVDGPGPDFIVFENAFGVNCDPTNIFAELATVSVSDDGVTWTDFPCTATKAPYGACAGTHVVYANAKTNAIDPTDPAVAGGDPYDLADIGVTRARFVRITDRVDLDGSSGVFDLDAVSIVHPFCP